MNRDSAHGERQLAVRKAAADWQRAGLIDEATRTAIEADFADDRQRVGTALRILLFVFAWIAAQSASGFFMLLGQGHGLGVISLVFAGLCAAACELLRGRLRRAESGAEEAAGLMAVGFALGGLGWILTRSITDDAITLPVLFALGALLCFLAAWRWGGIVYGASAGAGLLLLLLRFPLARWTWIAVPAIAVPPLLRFSESRWPAPSQRRAAGAAIAVLLTAAYCALHLGVWDIHGIEELSAALGGTREVTQPRGFAVWGTALVPLGLLVTGLATRRRLLLDLGLLTGAVSLATAAVYFDWRPHWLVLALAGIGAIAAALAARWLLDRSPGKERAGLTAEPLFENPDRRSLLEVAAALATLTPEARSPSSAPPGFAGGGGATGGGGSSSSF